MADSLFDTLQYEARRRNLDMRSRAARNWFRGRVNKLGRIDRRDLLKDPNLTERQTVGPGHMFMYFYDPKTKETLPYYDKFPLTIMVEPAPGGFYGLNLHYLAPGVRARFLDELGGTMSDKRFDERTKFRLSYDLLKGASRYKEFKPCFKRYLTSHVKTQFSKVDAKDWAIAIFLPTEDFAKKSKNYVWGQSRGMI